MSELTEHPIPRLRGHARRRRYQARRRIDAGANPNQPSLMENTL